MGLRHQLEIENRIKRLKRRRDDLNPMNCMLTIIDIDHQIYQLEWVLTEDNISDRERRIKILQLFLEHSKNLDW